MSPLRKAWPHLRAAAILVVGFVVLVAALPMPGPGKQEIIETPESQAEVQQWVDLLATLGWQTDRATLSDQVMWLSRTARSARTRIVDPARPVFRITGTYQGWGLFAYPDERPYVLLVEGASDSNGPYHLMYRSGDPEARWQSGLLQFRRVRAMFNPSRKAPRGYNGAVDWLARRAFDEDPDLQKVRVGFVQLHTTLPGEPALAASPAGKFRKVRRRADLLQEGS